MAKTFSAYKLVKASIVFQKP